MGTSLREPANGNESTRASEWERVYESQQMGTSLGEPANGNESTRASEWERVCENQRMGMMKYDELEQGLQTENWRVRSEAEIT